MYGDLLTTPEDTNHVGRVYRVYDGAGVATTVEFDFKGNPLEEQRQLVTSKTTQPDWSALLGQSTIAVMATTATSLLDAETFSATSERDAVNRVLTAISLDDSEVSYTYLEAKFRSKSLSVERISALKQARSTRQERRIMPLTLVWGKDFEFEQTTLSSGDTYDEVFGVDGGTLGISWKSIRDMTALSAEYGVTEDLWPVYPDCDVDRSVPLDDARTKSTELRTALEGVPDRVVSEDYWLSFLLGLLREGNMFFIMA